MISADLKGKSILVTGGGSGIGLATAELFARNGAKVAANHLAGDAAALANIAGLKAKGLDVISAPGNVGDTADADRMVKQAIADLGGSLFGLVNNAGVTAAKSPIAYPDLDGLTDEIWDRVLGINLVGPFRVARAASAALKASRGAIVNLASLAGLDGLGSSMTYAISKAGVIRLTRGLAAALAPDVRVNAVAPGYVVTQLTAGWSDERKAAVANGTLLKRPAQVEDIADCILYLVAGASYMTGQTLLLDGGEEKIGR